ncbi:MAG: sensor domain-containing diguanylate cyclase [bacterium]
MKIKLFQLIREMIKLMSGTILLIVGYICVRALYTDKLDAIFGGAVWAVDGVVLFLLIWNVIVLYLFLAKPLMSLSDYFGVVWHQGVRDFPFPQENKDLFVSLCNSIQREMDKSRVELQSYSQQVSLRATLIRELRQEYEKKVFDLFTLFDVARELNSTLNEKKISQTMLLTCMGQMGVRSAIIFQLEEFINFKLLIKDFRGIDLSETKNLQFDIGEDLMKYFLQTGKGVLIKQIQNKFKDNADYQKFVSLNTSLFIPFIDKKEIRYALAVGPKVSGESFTTDQIEFLSILTNLGSLALENAKLYTMATTDGLTKLFIQRYFVLKAEEEIKRSKRYSQPHCMLMIDVDNFKNINDTYGHLEGNKILKGIADILMKGTRDSDIVARYGGEEFAVLMPMTEKTAGYIVAERIRKMVEQKEFIIRDNPVHVTISIGEAGYPMDGETVENILDYADTMLYKAKTTGRNRVVVEK